MQRRQDRPTRPGLRLRLAALRYRFRESLFQLPAVIVVAGMLLSELTWLADERVGDPPFTLTMNSNAATWLLSTVAGAMITTAGVVFSLTVVSLQLASSQFSPRVMRSFIRDRLSQVVIGLLVASFVFSVLTLRHLDHDASEPAPSVSVTVAVGLAVVTVLLIIAHLNHLAARLQVGEVVRAIFAEGEETIDALARQVAGEEELTGIPELTGPGFVVESDEDGWVAQIDSRRMLAATAPGSVVRLESRTGAYIHRGEPLVTVWPVPSDPERVAPAVLATVEVAELRTMQQDVDFALRQLVDVGLRALSPAVNDPTTAVEVILRVAGLLRRLLVAPLPAGAVRGPDDKVLLRAWTLTHEEYVGHAFDQLRQAAGSQTQVLATLIRALRMLAVHVRDTGHAEHLPALAKQQRLVLDAVEAERGLCPEDRARLLAMADERTDPADHSRRLLDTR